MKNNIKRFISLTAILLCLLLLSACAAGEVMNDIEDHLKAELALQENNGATTETEDTTSDEPSEEISDTSSEEPSGETAEDSEEEPSEEVPVISENTDGEETAVSAAIAAANDTTEDDAATEEPVSEEPDPDTETEDTAEDADEDLGTVVKSIVTDRNSISTFHKTQRINSEANVTRKVIPAREISHFIVPTRETSSFQRITPRALLLISYESAVL